MNNKPYINNLFSRNILIFSQEEQLQFQKTKLGFFGVGMGSVVSELAVRTGFSNIFIADGDVVEPSNLNRQNFTIEDCGYKKVDALSKRLHLINPAIQLTSLDKMLNEELLHEIIPTLDIIYNFIDWDSVAFLSCHDLCKKYNKQEIFTLNLGTTSASMVIDPSSPRFDEFFNTQKHEEIKDLLIQYIIKQLPETNVLHKQLQSYNYYKKFINFDPQTALASYMSAWTSIQLTTELLRPEHNVEIFPNIYINDIESMLLTKQTIAKAA